MDALEEQVKACQKCPLSQTRTNTVFCRGNPGAELVFVGEAPGYYEDQQGLAFVGRAGKLLDDIITKGMGLSPDDVYICNVLKCRPPSNRDPGSTEMVSCLPYLERQLEIISPKVICCLGRIASQCLLETRAPMKELRGQWHTYRGLRTMVTYHPAYLLRNPADKKKSWLDIQQVMAELGLKRPKTA
ncbi:MAG: uracil-DNA glycosylase [Actinobacteria bacterium]|nr:uracil-DNA glycosylase [Actinomycetota bacterium]